MEMPGRIELPLPGLQPGTLPFGHGIVVGVTGFEPVASTSRTSRSRQAELHTEKLVRVSGVEPPASSTPRKRSARLSYTLMAGTDGQSRRNRTSAPSAQGSCAATMRWTAWRAQRELNPFLHLDRVSS